MIMAASDATNVVVLVADIVVLVIVELLLEWTRQLQKYR
jgi:hypothetical protein